MGIDFSPARWDAVKKNYALWWEGKLDRPLIYTVLGGKDPGRALPSTPLLDQSNCHLLSVPAKDIIDRIDYELSTQTYLGDSFPFFNMICFGPGIVAAFLGAELDNATGKVWFRPKEIKPIHELHFEYDPNNVWLNRLKDIYREGMKRWQGQVLMSMPDLGGTLDILSTFRPADLLLTDLYDEPEEAKRLTWELHELWIRYFRELHEVTEPYSPGWSDWAGMYCEEPSYILQCDFCYMLSPKMFDEFVKPELQAMCQYLPRSFYHLDGVGQLNKLDSLLEIKELDGVQWVPGAGKPDMAHWPEVYRKIAASDKNIQICGAFDCLLAVAKQTGKPGRIFGGFWQADSYEKELRRLIESYTG